MYTTPEDVLEFWFIEAQPEQWFMKDEAFDAEIKNRFLTLHTIVSQSGLWTWRNTNEGRLAEILVLDQFSRNIYRDSGKAFAQDALALGLAQTAVARSIDKTFPNEQRMFFYMPYMHSELSSVHEEAQNLFAVMGDEKTIAFEEKHFDIIKEFGRYPFRNEALGRENTPEEEVYLQGENVGF